MSMSDPIADMLTRIRNAVLREHKTVVIPSSKIKENIAKVLKSEGFITGYEMKPARIGEEIEISLKYDSKKESIIRKIDRVSKPGLRVHKGAEEIKPVLGGQGIYVVSTSQGVFSDAQCRAKHIGGEIVCSVY